jgi:BlaR1 peptidase M56
MESLVHGMLSNAAVVTVLAVLLAIVGRLARRPALIHSVCLLAMLKLLTPPIVSLPMPMPIRDAEPIPAPVVFDEPSVDVGEMKAEPDEERPILDGDAQPEELVQDDAPGAEAEAMAAPGVSAWSWEVAALALILAGTVGWWALSAWRIARFHGLLRDVEPLPAGWQAEAAALAERLGLRRPPAACLVPGDVPPMLWAFGLHVRLLIPSRLWATLSDDERTALLLHELAHLKRCDHWVRWIELVVAGLYWWHPAVWWIRRALREAEEQCCDAWVVWEMPQGGNKTYAAALVAVLEFLSGARTTPAAAASATLGNGHVSSLKRRLRMIVKAKTPRRLSWAGRLAVAGLSALLLPLAPSWGQRDDPASTDLNRQLRSAAAPLFEADIPLRLIELQASVESAEMQLARAQELAAAKGDERTKQRAAQLEERIKEEFKEDPDVQRLIEQINEARDKLEKNQELARDHSDPAIREVQQLYNKLVAQWNALWEEKHDEIKDRLQSGDKDQRPEAWEKRVKQLETAIEQTKKKRDGLKETLVALKPQAVKDDDKPKEAKNGDKDDEPKKDAKGHESAERIEGDLKALKEKLGKDLDPVGELVRKSLERSLDEIHQALKKEGMTAEDLRRALEKSHRDLHESLRRGGPVEKELRDAAERARKDMQEAMDRQLEGVLHHQEEMKSQEREPRDQQKKMAESMRDQMRRQTEQQRKAAEERQTMARRQSERMRDAVRTRMRQQVEARKEARAKAKAERPGPKAEERPATGDQEKSDRIGSQRDELDSARQEIRELQSRLREANNRLERLQRREPRRPTPPARPAEPARPAQPATSARPDEPARPAPAAPPARADEPRRPDRPDEPRRPGPPNEPGRIRERERDDHERRLREIEDKMDRLLKELQDLKGRPAPGARGADFRASAGN